MNRIGWLAFFLIVGLVVYVGTYAPLSAHGKYERVPHGFIGQINWLPKIGSPTLEFVFWPLIQLDRSFIHTPHHHC